jgi:hypothetical protein
MDDQQKDDLTLFAEKITDLFLEKFELRLHRAFVEKIISVASTK